MSVASSNPVAPSPRPSPRPSTLGSKLRFFAGDIKIQHTVFAMPWAILSAGVAGRMVPGSLGPGKIGLIVICMVMARTVAMGANRIFDAELDARNPRTARRALPAGALSRAFVQAVVAICAIGFVLASAGFLLFYANPWPVILSLPVLAYLAGYPFMKRFTRLCHYYLGIALALAPVCAWVAITGRMAWPPVIMFFIVAAWTAGFDIIYACQDYAVDVQQGLFSVPAGLGIARALWVSRFTHLVAAGLLIVLGLAVPQFGMFYFIGAALAIGLLVVEHAIVHADDLSRVNLSFFTINGVISVALAVLGIIDLLR